MIGCVPTKTTDELRALHEATSEVLFAVTEPETNAGVIADVHCLGPRSGDVGLFSTTTLWATRHDCG